MDQLNLIEILIQDYGDLLWNFCLRITNDRLVAEDLYQDTMVKAIKLKDKINLEDNPSAFLLSLATSINKNRFRRIFRRQRIAPIVDIDINSIIMPSEQGVEYTIELTELQKDINIGISNLPLKQRSTFLMFYMEDLTIKEIATSLNIAEGTVKSRIHTAKNKIKKELEGKGYE